MKTAVLPAPKGMPAAIGMAQWMEMGTHVHANHSSPMGQRMAAMQTMNIAASGGGLLVPGSFLCELIMRRINGSQQIVIMLPIPMPMKARPENPTDQPRSPWKTMG